MAVLLPLRAESDPRVKPLLARYAGAVMAVKATVTFHVSADVGGTQKTMPEKDTPAQGFATVVKSEGVLVSALSFFDVSSMMDGQTITGPKGQKAKVDMSMKNITPPS
ncbi:MAG: hypothetical protein ACREF9_08920 [Opitutaceae bacterium]